MAILLVGKEVLHAGDLSVGLLVTALAFGIGVGTIAAGWLSRDHIELGVVPFGSLLLGFFAVFLSFTPFLRLVRLLARRHRLLRRLVLRSPQCVSPGALR